MLPDIVFPFLYSMEMDHRLQKYAKSISKLNFNEPRFRTPYFTFKRHADVVISAANCSLLCFRLSLGLRLLSFPLSLVVNANPSG